MREPGLTPTQRFLKRTLDLMIAGPAFIATLPIVAVVVAVATVDTREWGIFSQERIGRYGRPFTIYKIRTMRSVPDLTLTSTTTTDPRISRSGRVFRRCKIDELPQLFNVVRGDMSLVGPRPDVSGFADCLAAEDQIILSVRPGITGPASILYSGENTLLSLVDDPETHSATVLWPTKVQCNREYVETYTLATDLRILRKTLAAVISGV